MVGGVNKRSSGVHWPVHVESVDLQPMSEDLVKVAGRQSMETAQDMFSIGHVTVDIVLNKELLFCVLFYCIVVLLWYHSNLSNFCFSIKMER